MPHVGSAQISVHDVSRVEFDGAAGIAIHYPISEGRTHEWWHKRVRFGDLVIDLFTTEGPRQAFVEPDFEPTDADLSSVAGPYVMDGRSENDRSL